MHFVACVAPLFRLVKGKISKLYSINSNCNNIDNIVDTICLPANALFFFEFVREHCANVSKSRIVESGE
jgi:hypothetical protein